MTSDTDALADEWLSLRESTLVGYLVGWALDDGSVRNTWQFQEQTTFEGSAPALCMGAAALAAAFSVLAF